MSTVDYRIVGPYQEPGHEDRPWLMARVEGYDGGDFISYLKIAWLDHDWICKHLAAAKQALREELFWRYINGRENWAYVDYSRVSYIYRRQGVATHMYKLGAAWLAKYRSTCLNASSVQSDAAKALWVALKADNNIPTTQTVSRRPTPISGEYKQYDAIDYSANLQLRLRAKQLLMGVACVSQPTHIVLTRVNFKVTNPHRLELADGTK